MKQQRSDSPTTLPLPPGEYEVFLSFRGPDTRHRITDLVYRFLVHYLKIRTFRDDDELRVGEGIWPELVRAIGQSKIYVVIFSESYAHSKWEGAIADHVSNVVWSHLSKNNYVLETDELVGIEDPIEEVVHKLNLDSGSVSSVGIHGIGGMGKTTLAMAVYNKISARFDRCSFLENIRETQQQKDGNLVLQKKLISNVMRSDSASISMVDTHEGKRIIKERVSRFKVLVVLDDVDEDFKFDELLGNNENFFPGSRFVITSRNVQVLRRLVGDHHCGLHEVQGMSPEHSLRLFCKHAFGMDSPPSGFETLSKDIISTTGGLPLTLKVVGSSLFKQEVDIWVDKLALLEKIPEKKVVERLRISYDTLGHEAKQIFLDIACFFIGKNKVQPSYMWSDCNFYPRSNINILFQRSMIKIGNHNEFHMHDQLRDMGREIVREEDVEHPWMRSRIWSTDEAEKLLLTKKGTYRVKAIRLNSRLDLEDEHFSNLSELRYFDGPYTTFRGDFSGLLPNLRWLELKHHEESSNGHLTNFHMKNLIIFTFSRSKVADDWGGWSHIKTAKKLKVLDLSNLSHDLTKLPEFPDSGSLEMLNLSAFGRYNPSSDAELDIGNLLNLKVLILSECKLRKIKGGTFGMMKGLFELDIRNIKCTENLREVLADIGELPLLKTLDVFMMEPVQVLAGIKLPTSLKKLSTSFAAANLVELLELRQLNISSCQPSTVGIPAASTLWWESSKLESLTLVNCPNLVMVPNSTLLPSSLTGLVIAYTTSEWLPSLENLAHLTKLYIYGCNELREIQGLGGLKSLQTIYIAVASRLTRLQGLGNLMSSSSDCKLTKLEISRCPNLPTALDDCGSGRELDVIHSLEEMYIVGCPLLDVGSIPRLSKLPRLKTLRIKNVSRFDDSSSSGSATEALLEGLGDLEELVELELVDLPTVSRLPSLSKLRELRRLVLRGIPNLQEVEGLEGLKLLESLFVAGCNALERFPATSIPSSSVKRIELDLRGCANFTTDLSSFTIADDECVQVILPSVADRGPFV